MWCPNRQNHWCYWTPKCPQPKLIRRGWWESGKRTVKCNQWMQAKKWCSKTNSSPIQQRLPLQASTTSNNYSTNNNFTGIGNFYGGFPGLSGPWNMPMPSYQSTCTEPQRSWKRIRASVLSDSDLIVIFPSIWYVLFLYTIFYSSWIFSKKYYCC